MAERGLKGKVVGFVQKHYRTHGEAPSLRTLCRELNTYTQKVYQFFPERMAGICQASGVPIPKKRIARTRKATRGRKAEAERRGEKEGGGVDGSPRSGGRGILEIYDEIDRQKALIHSELKNYLETMLRLLQDPRMSGEVKSFLAPHLPEILEAGWGVHHNLDTLLEVEVFLDRMKGRGWSVGMIPEYLTKWANLSSRERDAFRELCEEAEARGETPGQYVTRLWEERSRLQSDLEMLEEKRQRDPERRALEQQVQKLLRENETLRNSLDIQSARVNCLTRAISNCQSCQTRNTYFSLKDKRLSAELAKNPIIRALAGVS